MIRGMNRIMWKAIDKYGLPPKEIGMFLITN
jgi:hypothetical protein